MSRDLNVVTQRTDISNTPIDVGDWVILYDDENEQQHKFEVLTVLNSRKENARDFKVMVLESTDKRLKSGQILPSFGIVKDRVVWGSVRRYEDRTQRYTEYELNEIAGIELRKFLDLRVKENYRARFKTCLVYLQQQSILPKCTAQDKEQWKEVMTKLREIIKQREELLWSRGGWVGSTGRSFKQKNTNPAGQGPVPRKIDFRMYMAAERLRFESGFYGDIQLFNVD